ncbi:MAG: single-stranded DNA-binding protein [Thermodesulfobacteriota bacterium]
MPKSNSPFPRRQGYTKVFLLGYLRHAPELRRTPQGTRVCIFPLAVPGALQQSKGEQGGDLQIEVVAFGPLADYCQEALTAETHVFVEGSLVQRRWKNAAGVSESKYEVVAQAVRLCGGGRMPEDRR